jgi:hypothetical protein
VDEQETQEQERQDTGGGTKRLLLIGGLLLVLAVAAFVVVTVVMKPAPEPAPAPQVKAEPAPAPAPKAVEPEPAPEPEAPKATRPRPKKEKPAAPAPEAPPPPPAGPTLVIESDVPNASVFVDRQYLGTTPLKTTGVAPGRHQLNASADGEDGIVQSIDVAESGDTTITLRFKEVRLDASVAVVHKHGMGACEGRLVATASGMRYETPNKKDAFSMAFKDLEVFEIDYLKKELKVKQRGGKTWNFTDKTDNADKLFIFHRDVTKAREILGR